MKVTKLGNATVAMVRETEDLPLILAFGKGHGIVLDRAEECEMDAVRKMAAAAVDGCASGPADTGPRTGGPGNKEAGSPEPSLWIVRAWTLHGPSKDYLVRAALHSGAVLLGRLAAGTDRATFPHPESIQVELCRQAATRKGDDVIGEVVLYGKP